MHSGRNPLMKEAEPAAISVLLGLLDNGSTLSTRFAFTMLDIPRHLPLSFCQSVHSSASNLKAAKSAENCWKDGQNVESMGGQSWAKHDWAIPESPFSNQKRSHTSRNRRVDYRGRCTNSAAEN